MNTSSSILCTKSLFDEIQNIFNDIKKESNYSEAITYCRTVLSIIEKVILDKEQWFNFTKNNSDGRKNSQDDESPVVEFLLNHPLLKEKLVKKAFKKDSNNEDNRAFGDFSICLKDYDFEPFPCNIKIISEKNSAGNNTCGLINLMKYTFDRPCSNHVDVMKILVDIDKKGYDTLVPNLYGIVMIMKEKQKCWVGTLDEVPDKYIGTNPSNPLQIPFLESRVSRTSKEYITLLISKIIEYHKKKSEPLAIWHAYQESKKRETTNKEE